MTENLWKWLSTATIMEWKLLPLVLSCSSSPVDASLSAHSYLIFLPLKLCNLPLIICHTSKSSAVFCTVTIRPRSLRGISKYLAWSRLWGMTSPLNGETASVIWLQAIRSTGRSELTKFLQILWVHTVGLDLGLWSPEQQPVRKSLAIFGRNLSVTAVSVVRAIQNPRDGFVVMSVSTAVNSFVVISGNRAVSGLKNTFLGKEKPIFWSLQLFFSLPFLSMINKILYFNLQNNKQIAN